MSARVKTVLPLISKELVLEALQRMGETIKEEGHIIHILSKSNSFYDAKLIRIGGGRYVLIGDSDEITIGYQNRLTEAYRTVNESHKKKVLQKKINQLRLQAEQEEKEQKQELKNRIRSEQEEIRKRYQEQVEKNQPVVDSVEQVHLDVEMVSQEQARRSRIDEEKRQYVESQKKKVYDKAKAMGYKVKEKQVNGKLKLELVKRIY
ncbi:flagellar biosynthesis GTPase FlhF [Bacillus tianshenii]|uniref:Flagellar biosynthesis GTPase FlhF n=1 Tax=Sutcliffiella tianshenii TaxID=1463404 RepID=A0ABS2NZE0_9BACI|nr:hypothetical protein [Bacillus tianshenii]MBM7620069.1 flagellar biosynthesis GTPase FlhF [Bacillus tianshenii]